MRNVGNQIRLHSLVFQLVLHGDTGCLGNLIDSSGQLIQFTVSIRRNLIVQITTADFFESLLNFIVLVYPFGGKD